MILSDPFQQMRNYLRDPKRIYQQSFETITKEVDLTHYSPAIRTLVKRVIHACGMTDIIHDLVVSDGLTEVVREAMTHHKIFCDSRMVQAGILARYLPPSLTIACSLDHPDVRQYAKRHQLTLSAAAMACYSQNWQNAILIIGNAPTALFELLYQLKIQSTKPAAIIAFPVGFVGAAESKDLLVKTPHGIPFITLLGRRGGSAMAAAALNGILVGDQTD